MTVPYCATWKGIFTHHPRHSPPSLPPAGVCPSVQRGWPPPPATLFLSNVGPSVQRGPVPPHPSLPPAGVYPSVHRGWSPPPTTPFLSRVGPSVQRGPTPPLESPLRRECDGLCNVHRHLLASFAPFCSSSGSVPICATWMVTSSRNLPFLSRKGPSVQRGPAPPLESPPPVT
jgi:hypothetical protein